jgi:hypothetical protein
MCFLPSAHVLSLHTPSTSATLASLLFPQYTKHISASGPLHLLSPFSWNALPLNKHLACLTPLDLDIYLQVSFSDKPSLTSPLKEHPPSRTELVIH